MDRIVPLVSIGFCTDGDWVANDKSGKLVCLRQGADERVVGEGTLTNPNNDGTIVFPGISKGGGIQRIFFVDEMHGMYGEKFLHVQRGAYRRVLADLIHNRIVVSPDSPKTDRYWSNRVYNVLGFGGFLLHPDCKELHDHYTDGVEIEFYQDRAHLHYLIDLFSRNPEGRYAIGMKSLERTRKEHLYRHRCETLLKVLKDRGITS